MEAEPFKIRPRPEGGYSGNDCAALRCRSGCDVVDGTHRFWPFHVPLCSHHFEIRPDPPKRLQEKAVAPEPEVAVEEPPAVAPQPKEPDPQPEKSPRPRRQKLESYRLF